MTTFAIPRLLVIFLIWAQLQHYILFLPIPDPWTFFICKNQTPKHKTFIFTFLEVLKFIQSFQFFISYEVKNHKIQESPLWRANDEDSPSWSWFMFNHDLWHPEHVLFSFQASYFHNSHFSEDHLKVDPVQGFALLVVPGKPTTSFSCLDTENLTRKIPSDQIKVLLSCKCKHILVKS